MYIFDIQNYPVIRGVRSHIAGNKQPDFDWLDLVDNLKVTYPVIDRHRHVIIEFDLDETHWTAADIADHLTKTFETDVIVTKTDSPKREAEYTIDDLRESTEVDAESPTTD